MWLRRTMVRLLNMIKERKKKMSEVMNIGTIGAKSEQRLSLVIVIDQEDVVAIGFALLFLEVLLFHDGGAFLK